jgi:hypothetical protein
MWSILVLGGYHKHPHASPKHFSLIPLGYHLDALTKNRANDFHLCENQMWELDFKK